MIPILYRFASPKIFYELSGRLLPWFAVLCAALFTYGLIGGLILAPADYQQGDAFRIIYIHVPSAFLSMAVYSTMAFCAFLGMVWQIKLADIVIKVSAPIGASFTFLALFTGALWGKPMWGTYWIWDARLTSELILLFLYFGIIALRSAIPDQNIASRAVNLLVLVGVVNLPIIHYSVNWWNTLHQGATLSKFARPSIDSQMLYPLLAMIIAFFCFYLCMMLMRTRSELLWRERKSSWVRKYVGALL